MKYCGIRQMDEMSAVQGSDMIIIVRILQMQIGKKRPRAGIGDGTGGMVSNFTASRLEDAIIFK